MQLLPPCIAVIVAINRTASVRGFKPNSTPSFLRFQHHTCNPPPTTYYHPHQPTHFSIPISTFPESTLIYRIHMSTARANHWNIVLSPTYSRNNSSNSSTSTSTSSTSNGRKSKKAVSKPFKCPICARCFERTGHLQTHITAVHEQKQPYKCDYPGCLQSFGHRSSLSRHRKGIHKAV